MSFTPSHYVAVAPSMLFVDPDTRRIVLHEPVFTRFSTACGMPTAAMSFLHRKSGERIGDACKSCQRALRSHR